MSAYRYPKSALMGDYARGGIGLAITLLPVLATPMMDTLRIIFAVVALLFAGYVFRTWARGSSVVEVDDTGIRTVGPFGRAIPWDTLESVTLSYYSTRRDRTEGWMQLDVRGGGNAISIESHIDGFEEILARCGRAANGVGIALSESTVQNFQAAGVPLVAGAAPSPAGGGSE